MLINIHTHTSSSDSFEIVSIHGHNDTRIPTFPFSIGCHPWFSDQTIRPDLESIMKNDSCLAVGECGLDTLKGPHLNQQLNVFEEMVKLSEAVGKPLIIHCVRALNELIACKKRLKPKQPWIVHGLTRRNWIVSLIENGFYLSVGEAVLKNDSLRNALVQDVPLDRIFMETDDANCSILHVYESISSSKNLPLVALEKQIEENFRSVFGYGKLA